MISTAVGQWLFFVSCSAFVALAVSRAQAAEPTTADRAIEWLLDRTDSIGGHSVLVKGAPQVIATEHGKAVAFDGRQDALVVPANPLAGWDAFTVEAIFRPAADPLKEPRFIHLQGDAGSRVMLEIRTTADNQWYADTFMRSDDHELTLRDPKLLHPVGRWYNLTLVNTGRELIQYVNGQKEVSGSLVSHAMEKGQTSLGARLNDVNWLQGAILKLRFTPRALRPEEFLRLDK